MLETLNLFSYPVFTIAMLVGMILTFKRPRIWKYNTLLGCEGFTFICWSLRYRKASEYNKFEWFDLEEAAIILCRPPVGIFLIITVVVCLCTRERWCIQDKPGFCE